jgi:hypothetical protein
MSSRPAATTTGSARRSATARAAKAEPKAPISIIAACEDPQIFAPWFRDKETWSGWFCFLKVMFGLPLDEAELAIFRECTGRSEPRPAGYLECALICGRRGGKSLILALISTYLACFFDWSEYLTAGERATVSVIAADRKQASTILRYVRGMLGVPLLGGMIERETNDAIDLRNRVSIEIATANYRTVRGKTIVAGLADELAFWQSDDLGANPDVEIINALRPAMATIPRAMLLKASSPYSRKGVLWSDFRKHYAKDESPVLVWKAATRTMNPSVPESFIAAAYEDDPASAAAEYGAEFRTDVEGFVTREAIEAVTSPGVIERGFITGQRYFAFTDPSGGSSDSMTLAVGHLEQRNSEKTVVLDAVREVRAPFSPEQVVDEFVKLLQSYKITTVTGDRYGSSWVSERFSLHGCAYKPAEKAKSDLYKDVLPAINSRQVDFLDHPKLLAQFVSLERRVARGGRDSIDHPPGGKDDVANAVAGLCCLIRADSNVTRTRQIRINFMGR